MDEASSARGFDRRKFLNGRWARPADPASSCGYEIASILVRAKPDRLDAVARDIEALSGVQIYSVDPRGKLVVVIEASDVGSIGTTFNIISLLPHVLTAALVFHATDES